MPFQAYRPCPVLPIIVVAQSLPEAGLLPTLPGIGKAPVPVLVSPTLPPVLLVSMARSTIFALEIQLANGEPPGP